MGLTYNDNMLVLAEHVALADRASVLEQEASNAGDDGDPASRLRIYDATLGSAAGLAAIAHNIQGFSRYVAASPEVLRDGYEMWIVSVQKFWKAAQVAPDQVSRSNLRSCPFLVISVYSRFHFVPTFDKYKFMESERSMAPTARQNIDTYDFSSMHAEIKVNSDAKIRGCLYSIPLPPSSFHSGTRQTPTTVPHSHVPLHCTTPGALHLLISPLPLHAAFHLRATCMP